MNPPHVRKFRHPHGVSNGRRACRDPFMRYLTGRRFRLPKRMAIQPADCATYEFGDGKWAPRGGEEKRQASLDLAGCGAPSLSPRRSRQGCTAGARPRLPALRVRTLWSKGTPDSDIPPYITGGTNRYNGCRTRQSSLACLADRSCIACADVGPACQAARGCPTNGQNNPARTPNATL